jgi:hypothetical protein
MFLSDPRTRLIELSRQLHGCPVPISWNKDGSPVMVLFIDLNYRNGYAWLSDARLSGHPRRQIELLWHSKTCLTSYAGPCNISRLETTWQEAVLLRDEMVFELSQLHLHAQDSVVTMLRWSAFAGQIDRTRRQSLHAFFKRAKRPTLSWHAACGYALKSGSWFVTRAEVACAFWDMACPVVNTELEHWLPAPLVALTVSLLKSA